MVHVLVPLVLLLSGPQENTEAGTGPQPSPTPISWEFQFTFLDPRRIELQLPGLDRPEVYWYMVYTVTNTSGRAHRFFPLCQLVTEDLKVIDTDMGISPLVFDAIKERHRVTHKYLVEPTLALGALLTGDDNARESVAIWRQGDITLNHFKVYVAGLSGETRFVRNPAYRPDQPETKRLPGSDGRARDILVNPKHFTLRKTLEISYSILGSPAARLDVEPERGEIRWVMR